MLPPTNPPASDRSCWRPPAVVALLAALLLTACAAEPVGSEADGEAVERPADVTSTPGAEEGPSEDETPDDPGSGTDDGAAGDAGPPPPPDLGVALALEEIASLRSPVAGAVGPDGVLYLAERGGTVRPLTAEGPGAPVVDLSAATTTESERGLLGMAFAADGSELYLSFTDLDGDSTLSAVAIENGVVQPEPRRVLLTVAQPYANHNGGDLHVGPDGLLYYALGDGGSAGDPLDAGQDRTTALGGILRLDPLGGTPYAVPDTNPFVDEPGAVPELWIHGLRNPWRFSFDAVTDTVWIADVGQDAREEINRLPLADAAGANLGWNRMEGTEPYTGTEPADHVPPVYEYRTRGEEGCAVTGGVVYRGSAIPELVGAYLYADFCNGRIRALAVDADGEVVEQADLGIDGGQVVAFVPDADGEVLVLDLGGAVRRIVPA